jgi:uncharacterized membrane protein
MLERDSILPPRFPHASRTSGGSIAAGSSASPAARRSWSPAASGWHGAAPIAGRR